MKNIVLCFTCAVLAILTGCSYYAGTAPKFTFGPAPGGQAPATVTFIDTSREHTTSRLWNPGDINTHTGAALTTNTPSGVVVHTYANAGIYLATLTHSGPSNPRTTSNYVLVTSGNIPGGFTNAYGVFGGSNIVVSPASAVGIFYEGDSVTISNSLGTTIEVYDYHFRNVTNATPPAILTGLGLGHYFVQVDGNNGGLGDRAQFSVLPRGYTNSPRSDVGMTPPGYSYEQARMVRLAPGFTRLQQNWNQITTNGTTFDFSFWDHFAQQNSNVPVKVMNVILGHDDARPAVCNSCGIAPTTDNTNSISFWLTDISVLFSNLALHYTNSFVYEPINEPSTSAIVFTNPADGWTDPYWSSAGAVLPAAMAVSAAVHVIKFVCPDCQVWGPAALQIYGWQSEIFTNSYVPPYYAGLDALTYHLGNTYGPVDAFDSYSNRMDSATQIPLDAATKQVNVLYPGKPMVITEAYPSAPDDLGKINPWYLEGQWNRNRYFGGYSSRDIPQLAWDWRLLTARFWKSIIINKAAHCEGILFFCGIMDQDAFNAWSLTSPANCDYSGWDINGGDWDWTGCGPRPTVDGQAMLSWWLNGGTAITNWLSGTPVTRVTPTGILSNGCVPGLHFWEFQFADGATNTFIWADESYSFAANFGVGLTDVYSNQWTGSIGSEPVIAWGWPKPRPRAAE
jgi:PKD repeat protein